MTAPDPAVTTATEAPVYRFDGLVVSGIVSTDTLGRQWHLTGEKGWFSGGTPRTNRDDRPDADGSYRSAAFRGEKLFTVQGSVNVGARPELLEQTLLDLAAVCGDGRPLYTVRRTAGASDQTRDAELDGEPEVEPVGRYDIDFQFTFAAPDPRKHDYRWQEPRASPPVGSGPNGGLDYDGGLDYSAGGLDYGTANDPLVALVANYGSATAAPFFELRGNQPPCSILRDETGDRLDYLGYVATGERVQINCDDFAVRGIPARSAISTTSGDVTSLLVVSRWPVVAAQDVAAFRLLGSGPPESLTAALRSAWK